jgi:hypothetical protein
MLAVKPVVMCNNAFKVRKIVVQKRLRDAINHARYICKDYENSKECRAAWDIVEELSSTDYNLKMKNKNKKPLLADDDDWEEISSKLYDI